MTVKTNKTTMIDEYINNNIDMLIKSNKTLEELCEDFNKNHGQKVVSFSLFYNSFKKISEEKGLTKKRTRKTKKELQEAKQKISQENSKQLLEPEPKQEPEPEPEPETNKQTNKQTKIYGIERYLNKHQKQTFEISKFFPNNQKYLLILDMDKCFSVNDYLYVPVACILSKSNIYTNEEYNEQFKTSHPTKQNKYINVVRMKPGTYKYRFYVVSYCYGDKYIIPFCKTSYKEYEDITELIKYEEEPEEETEEEPEEETSEETEEETE